MSTGTFAPPDRQPILRQVERCYFCGLNQFVTHDRKCRRCRKPVVPEADAQPKCAAIVIERSEPPATEWPHRIGRAIVEIRQRDGISQNELGRRMRCVRSYVSRIENGLLEPKAEQIVRLAAALQVTVAEILEESAAEQRAILRSMKGDPFLQALASSVRGLPVVALDQLLWAARNLAAAGQSATLQ